VPVAVHTPATQRSCPLQALASLQTETPALCRVPHVPLLQTASAQVSVGCGQVLASVPLQATQRFRAKLQMGASGGQGTISRSSPAALHTLRDEELAQLLLFGVQIRVSTQAPFWHSCPCGQSWLVLKPVPVPLQTRRVLPEQLAWLGVQIWQVV
jgi:hypothetical protein